MKNNIEEVTGDLLKVKEGLILQQTNCICVRPHGLSEDLAKVFPYCNLYGRRRAIGNQNLAILKDRDLPGTVKLCFPNKIVGCLNNAKNETIIKAESQQSSVATILQYNCEENKNINKHENEIKNNENNTINIDEKFPIIGCLFAQFTYGRPGTWRGSIQDCNGTTINDNTVTQRLTWFKKCLENLTYLLNNDQVDSDVKNINTIYIPWLIGCGLGGYKSNWNLYKQEIVKFAQCHPNKFIKIVTKIEEKQKPTPTKNETKYETKNETTDQTKNETKDKTKNTATLKRPISHVLNLLEDNIEDDKNNNNNNDNNDINDIVKKINKNK